MKNSQVDCEALIDDNAVINLSLIQTGLTYSLMYITSLLYQFKCDHALENMLS